MKEDDTMNKETQEIFDKLEAFYEEGIPVHFTDIRKFFYNGQIISLNKKRVVINEVEDGYLPIPLYNIYAPSIAKYNPPKNEQ